MKCIRTHKNFLQKVVDFADLKVMLSQSSHHVCICYCKKQCPKIYHVKKSLKKVSQEILHPNSINLHDLIIYIFFILKVMLSMTLISIKPSKLLLSLS